MGYLGNRNFAIDPEKCLDRPLMSEEHRADAEEFLTTLAAAPFDIEDPRCAHKLRELWELIFVEESLPDLPADDRWKRLGFQSRTPHTDFRGGGVFSLDCLIYMAKKNRSDTQRILQDVSQASGYPFVPACINVCVLILCHLRLTDCVSPVSFRNVPQCTRRRQKKMMAFLSTGDIRESFGDLFIQVMLKLHQIWLNAGSENRLPGLHDFGHTIMLTGISLRALINRVSKMQTTDDFAAIMDISPEAWSTCIGNGWCAFVDLVIHNCLGE